MARELDLGEAGWAAAAVGLLGMIGTWVQAWRKGRKQEAAKAAAQPADLLEQVTAFSRMVDERSKNLIDELVKERAELRIAIAAQAARIDALEQENLVCRGENAQMVQRFESLSRFLRSKGIAVPDEGLARAFIEIKDGQPEVLISNNPAAPEA